MIEGIATLRASLSSQKRVTVPLLCRHRRGQGWCWIGGDYYFHCGIQFKPAPGRRTETVEGGQERAECEGPRLCLGLQPSSSVIPVCFIFLPFPYIFVLPPHASFPVEADLTRLPEIPCAFAPKPESQIMIAECCAQACVCPPSRALRCPVRFCLATDHMHGVLALGQRGQLRLGVVQAHSLPQGPEVTWVALLSTHRQKKPHRQ